MINETPRAVSVIGCTSGFQSESGGSIPATALTPFKCHQKTIKEQKLRLHGERKPVCLKDGLFIPIGFREAKAFILEYEWLGTMPSGFHIAYGILWNGELGALVVFGAPNPKQIARSVLSGKFVDDVGQLHRGASAFWAHEHTSSFLISKSLKELKKRYKAVVAFSDPMAGEIGTVYQATNWLFCGWTEKRPDYYNESGKRMVGNFKVAGQNLVRKDRPRKRRYVYLLDSKVKQFLKWPVLSYEKRHLPNQPPHTEK